MRQQFVMRISADAVFDLATEVRRQFQTVDILAIGARAQTCQSEGVLWPGTGIGPAEQQFNANIVRTEFIQLY